MGHVYTCSWRGRNVKGSKAGHVFLADVFCAHSSIPCGGSTIHHSLTQLPTSRQWGLFFHSIMYKIGFWCITIYQKTCLRAKEFFKCSIFLSRSQPLKLGSVLKCPREGSRDAAPLTLSYGSWLASCASESSYSPGVACLNECGRFAIFQIKLKI